MIDWDAYRAAYPQMGYADVAAFHARIWAAYPDQEHHSPELLAGFFDGLGAVDVVEVGGWRGSAAARMLAVHPDIVAWTNYEVCEAAVRTPLTTDPRYRAVFPDRWPWEMPTGRHDVAVLAHVIEHMTAAQLRRLVGWLRASGVRAMYVEAPLREAMRSWRHASSAHVLTIGWSAVIHLFARSGFVVRERHYHDEELATVLYLRRSS